MADVIVITSYGHYTYLDDPAPCRYCGVPLNQATQCYPGSDADCCLRTAQAIRGHILRCKRRWGTARSLVHYARLLTSYVMLKREYTYCNRRDL